MFTVTGTLFFSWGIKWIMGPLIFWNVIDYLWWFVTATSGTKMFWFMFSWDNRTRYPNFLVGILFYFGTMICIFILPFGTTKGKHIVPWRMLSGTWNHFLGCIYSHAADSDFGFLHEGLDLSLHYLTISGCRFSMKSCIYGALSTYICFFAPLHQMKLVTSCWQDLFAWKLSLRSVAC